MADLKSQTNMRAGQTEGGMEGGEPYCSAIIWTNGHTIPACTPTHQDRLFTHGIYMSLGYPITSGQL